MSAKDPSALKTIGEVAEELDIAPHVLRFWEGKFPYLSPKKRRGRRYYKPEDVVELKKIKTLLYEEGYTIKGVQKYFKDKKHLTAANESSEQPIAAHALTLAPNTDTPEETTSTPAGLSDPEVKKLKGILHGMCNLRDFLQQKPLI